MAGAIAMRLVPEALVPRALSIYGAASLATILAAPPREPPSAGVASS